MKRLLPALGLRLVRWLRARDVRPAVTIIQPPEPREARRRRPFLPPVPFEEAWTGFYLHSLIKRRRTDTRGGA